MEGSLNSSRDGDGPASEENLTDCAGGGKFHAFRPHPWHGLEAGDNVPDVVNAFVEITPFDLVKYEVDKVSGYLRVDRPQRTSSQPPALYGFIPKTLCAERVHRLSPGSVRGDNDPLDICVISERPITKSEVIVRARPIGGLQMNDGGEADDKIIAVLQNDHVCGKVRELHDLPSVLLERIRHYFETYKIIPGRKPSTHIRGAYGKAHAARVIRAAIQDYDCAYAAFGQSTDNEHAIRSRAKGATENPRAKRANTERDAV